MAEGEIQKERGLEEVLDKLLTSQAGQGNKDFLDSLLLLSLVNLLGIVSLLNKQTGVTFAQAPGPARPVLKTLLQMVSGQQQGAPDPFVLLKMLGNLMGAFAPGAGSATSGQQEQKPRVESGPSAKGKEIKKAEEPVKWDARLGKLGG